MPSPSPFTLTLGISREIFDDWMHSEEASTPDNSRKEQIRVYRGYEEQVDPATGRRGYGLHWRRAQEGNIKELLARWHASTAATKFRLATATPKRPGGVLLGRKQLVKWRCLCVKLRAATFADCKICSFVEEGMKLWHQKRFGWRREYLKKHPDHVASCHICSDPELSKLYQEMSRSHEDLKRVLLRCGKTMYPDYTRLRATGPSRSITLSAAKIDAPKRRSHPRRVRAAGPTSLAPIARRRQRMPR